jgi:hypothetical protein
MNDIILCSPSPGTLASERKTYEEINKGNVKINKR